ncbi:MAG: FAD-dependent oxidoreductase [Thaumarchaeota archaeon]|nr:FAD-dependent oxidoreductase [Nitrososphaerota archaeon]
MESRTSRGWGGQAVETTVVASRRLTPQTHGIMVEKPAGFAFRPTQFTFLSLKTDMGWDVRPMSIATSTTRPSLEYAVRIGDSPFKRAFASLRPGDTVAIQGPFGHFILEEDRPAVLIAGGIGITPLKGMAEYAADNALPIQVRLVYSNRNEEDIAYRAELEELEKRNPRFRVAHTLTGARAPKGWKGSVGRINPRLLRDVANALDRPAYYVCGKTPMVAEMVRLLSEFGVPESDVHLEVFRGYRT